MFRLGFPNYPRQIVDALTRMFFSLFLSLSFKLALQRYAINNDRWTPGFGERL